MEMECTHPRLQDSESKASLHESLHGQSSSTAHTCMHITAAQALSTLLQHPLRHGYTGARRGTLEAVVEQSRADVGVGDGRVDGNAHVHVLTEAGDPAGESYVIHVPGFWRSHNESSHAEFQNHWDLHPPSVATIVLAGKVRVPQRTRNPFIPETRHIVTGVM